jgi:hypothetical protein
MHFIKPPLTALVVFCLIFPASVIFSATEDFPVQALVGSDATAPSVPASLVATGVATTQIDLTWATSTDNFLLSGYHVWRDNVHIATTTLPLYSDTGLTASTSYVYYVTAFDSSFNFSASSSMATGTTLSVSTSTATTTTDTEDSDGTVYGSKAHSLAHEIQSLTIIPSIDSVKIRFETKNAIRTIVRWGEGSSFDTGSLVEDTFSRTHVVTITGLVPGKRYEYILEGETGIGRSGVMHQGNFVTLPPVDVFAPGNVTQLSLSKHESDLLLTWKNPEDADFAKVRIVYSDRFYPVDIADGSVVYEGKGEDFTDQGRGAGAGRHYYTVFSYDELGNISSGAIISLSIGVDGTVATSSPEEGNPEQNEIKLSLLDLIFSQDGEVLFPNENTIAIDGTKQLTIAIPYDRVPEHLKTILVKIQSPSDASQSFSFLLRINKDKSAYTSVIAPFGISGVFPFVVTVFDFKTSQIGYTNGVLDSQVQGVVHSEKNGSDAGGVLSILFKYSYIVWLVLLLTLLTLMGRRLMRAKW